MVPNGYLGYLTVWPTGQTQPLVSTLNSLDGRIKANAAIIPAGGGGAVSVYASDTTQVVLDVNGYFVPSDSSALAFFPLAPCRVVDTRNSDGPLGGPALERQQPRDFPLLQSTCGIPSSAQAYSLNFTAVPHNALGYLTVWPSGQSQPLVSTLNDLTGTIVANAAIVPTGSGGDISVFPSDETDLVIDVNGYLPLRLIRDQIRCRSTPPGPAAPSIPGRLTANSVAQRWSIFRVARAPFLRLRLTSSMRR